MVLGVVANYCLYIRYCETIAPRHTMFLSEYATACANCIHFMVVFQPSKFYTS